MSLVLLLLPSTISSESSTKNSFKGGLLGRFRVLRSCWILVDTLLLTGTPRREKTVSENSLILGLSQLLNPLRSFYF